MAERIRVEVTADADDLRRALRQASGDLKGFDRDIDTSSKHVRAARGENDRAAASYQHLGSAMGQVNKQATFARNLFALVKPAALITGLGLAGQAGNAAAAGLAATTTSLTDLIGLAPAGIQAVTAIGQAIGTIKLATTGLDSALKAQTAAQDGTAASAKKYREELGKLTPEARDFIETLGTYRPLVHDLQREAQKGLFPGAERGLRDARANADAVKKIVAETSAVLGRNAARTGQFLGTKSVGRDLASLGAENAKVLDRGARAGLNFANAARHILVEVEPLTDWLSLGVLHLSQLVEQETAAARKSGDLSRFFEETRETAAHLASIIESLAGGLWEVGKAAKPLGDDILADLDKTADHWEKWTQSVEGHNALQAYFADAKPALYEAGRLVDDLVTGFLHMGSTPETAALIRQLRTELLPVLFDLVENTTKAFGPHLVNALVQVAKLFGDLAGSSGPLVAFVDTIALAAHALHELLQDFPELQYAVVTLSGGIGVYKALQLGAALTGVGKLIKLLQTTKTEAAAVGAVNTVNAVTVGDPLAGGGRGKGRVAGALSKASTALPIAGALVIGGIELEKAHKDKQAEESARNLARVRGELNKSLGDPKKWRAMGDAVDYLQNRMRTLRPEGVRAMSDAMRQLGLDVDTPKRDIRQTADELQRLTDKARAFQQLGREGVKLEIDSQVTSRGADAIATALNRMRTAAFDSLDDIKTHTRLNMRLVARYTVDGSADSKAALAQNFRNAADAVRDEMHRAGKTTKEGLDLIESYMRRALAQYGITGKHATRYLNGQDTLTGKSLDGFGGRGMARGGMVRLPGAPGPDSIPMMLNGVPVVAAPGEDIAVINKHQRPVIDAGLEQVGVRGGLAGLFKKVTRPHHMAGGGIVGLGRQLQAQGYHVSENPAFGGVHPVHAPGSLHYSGQALDVNADDWPGGETKALDTLAARLRAQHWHILWQVLGHFDHLHVDTLGGGGGPATIPKLKRVLAKGLGGSLRGLVQGALDGARGGAQQRLEDIVASTGIEGAVGGGRSSAGGQYDRGALQRLWTQAGGDPARARLMAAIALAESGGNAGAHNPSGASGLWQILGLPFQGDVYDPLTNARMAVAKYRSQGLGAWEAYTNGNYAQYLSRGGLLHAAAGAHIAGNNPFAHGLHGNRFTGLPNRKHSRKRRRRNGQPYDGLPILARFRKAAAHLDGLEGPKGALDFAELQANATDEQQLKTVTIDGQQLDVRDEDGIRAHLTELTGLIGIRDQIDTAKREQEHAARDARKALERSIFEYRKEATRIRNKVAENLARIRRLRADLRSARDALDVEGKKKHGGSRTRKTQLRSKIAAIAGQIDGYGRENIALTGDPDRVGAGGRLGKVTDAIAARQSPLGELAQVIKDSPYDIEANAIDRGKLAREYEQWSGTTAPTPTSTGGSGDQSGLLRQIAETALRNLALERAQVPVLSGFRDLLGMRLVGSFAHGVDRVRESGLAIVHKDEQIVTDPQGPYGSQLARGGGAPVVIELKFADNSSQLVRLVDARIDGRAQRVVSQQNGRMSRVIAAAPGGG